MSRYSTPPRANCMKSEMYFLLFWQDVYTGLGRSRPILFSVGPGLRPMFLRIDLQEGWFQPIYGYVSWLSFDVDPVTKIANSFEYYVRPLIGLVERFLQGTELEFVIMVIAVPCVKLLSAHNSTQHTSRKHTV